jgi:hypothetical protein
MAEEWRASLVTGSGGPVNGSPYGDLIRNRLGGDVAVSAKKTHLYVYAASAKAAEEAGQVARAVLEEQALLAVVRLERWDPASGQWRAPGDPAEDEDDPGQGACAGEPAWCCGLQPRLLSGREDGGDGDEARAEVLTEALGLGVGAGGAGHAGREQAVDDEVDG